MISILKYNAGNIKSVQNALNSLGYKSVITDDPKVLMNSDKIIFPGVGEAGSAMKYIRDRGLEEIIKSLKQPVLGICLGLQLMCRYTEEGNTKCMDIFNTDVKLFPKSDKVPHMGWNNFLSINGELFTGIEPENDVYYVHSYYAEISSCTSSVCDYILPFSASMKYKNFYATQFHPEKSAGVGQIILQNFLKL